MKAHWQRGMLVSGLALIGWALVAFSVQANTPQDQGMRQQFSIWLSKRRGSC